MYWGENNLTKCELEILNVFWQADRALTKSDIISLSQTCSWSKKSIYILLNGLLEKGVIYEAGSTRCGKTMGRLFAPSIHAEEYWSNVIKDITPHMDIIKLVVCLIKLEKVDEQTLHAIKMKINDTEILEI